MNSKIMGMVSGFTFMVLVGAFSFGYVSNQGGVRMKTEKVKAVNSGVLWDGLSINATETGTSTAYRLGENHYFGASWQLAGGGPDVVLTVHTSPDKTSWTTDAVATLTSAAQQTSTDFISETFKPNVTEWYRFQYVGQAGNGTDTTFTMWRSAQ